MRNAGSQQNSHPDFERPLGQYSPDFDNTQAVGRLYLNHQGKTIIDENDAITLIQAFPDQGRQMINIWLIGDDYRAYLALSCRINGLIFQQFH